ncbi:MAG: 2-oxo acid dehydrogenase subunit E2 [Planctomycetes bacterium]|nr:2-oxo acid dehydrogenase subunit E2 [Planctomycetota bacterium]
MPIEVRLPKLGLTMDEGTIISWKKKEGDEVREGEILYEVETDKVTMEVESPASGVLRRIVAGPGTKLLVGGVAAIVTAAGEAEDESKVPAVNAAPPATVAVRGGGGSMTSTGPQAAEPARRAAPGGVVAASPAAKRLAREHGIDLSAITGTGPGGRIVELDVQKAVEAGKAGAGTTVKRQLRTSVRRATARRMIESFQTAPHFYLTIEARADRLAEMRKLLLPEVEKETGLRLSFTDLIVYFLGRSLAKHPLANARWQDGEVRMNPEVNINLAMATPDGLVAPVIRQADTLSPAQIARRRAELEHRAKGGQLGLEDLQGGTFTLTNLGAWGIDVFSPIINPPQAAILAAGSIRERAVAVDGKLEARPTLWVTLAADHRVLDGADAADVLKTFKELLENAEFG